MKPNLKTRWNWIESVNKTQIIKKKKSRDK